MKVAEFSNVKLNWQEDGNPAGKTVFLANSLGTDLRLWNKIIPLLPKELRYIRYDKRGHGLSSCPKAPYSMDDLVEDTENLLDALNIKSCLFIGLSIGGMIGQSLAVKRPDLINALVLSNTASKFGDASIWDERITSLQSYGIESMTDVIMERWFAESFRKSSEIEAWRNMLQRTPLEGYIGCCSAISGTDLSQTTSTIKQPTLCIAGEQDGSSPPSLVQSLCDLIQGSKFEVINDAAHLPCVEKPVIFAEHVVQFMKEVDFV